MQTHSTEPLPPAYSFTRFSSPEQAEGDSLRRQTESTLAWCERNGFQLDTTLKLHHVGSAFRGKHLDAKYALGQFLKLVERGRVPRGSYLIIENLDRLSREEERHALRLWMDLLDAGVNIVQLVPETIFRHDKIDMVDIMRAIIELSRGHSESRMKSERIGKAWAERKRLSRENGDTLTQALPGWIEERRGKRQIKSGAKVAIKKIFRLAAHGYGEIRITRMFNLENIPHFGKKETWTQSYIRKLLRDRRLLGEHQPRIKATGQPDGEVIQDYFPRVLEDSEFYAAQRSRDGRKPAHKNVTQLELLNVNELHKQGKTVADIARLLGVNRNKVYRAQIKLGLRKKPSNDKPHGIYLFAGMVKALWDERRYVMATWMAWERQYKILMLKGNDSTTYPYYVFERAILHELKELDPRSVLDGTNGHDNVVALEGEYGAVDAEIQQINADMDVNGFSHSLGKRVRQLEARLADVAGRLAAAKQKAANPLSASWGEAKTLLDALDSAADQEDARVRLRAALRRIIASIGMQVVTVGRDRLAFLNIAFTGEHENHFRSYTVWYRPRPKGAWAVESVAGSIEDVANNLRTGHAREENEQHILEWKDRINREGFRPLIELFLTAWHKEISAKPEAWHPLPD